MNKMTTNLVSEIEIDAPPQQVWQVLTDLAEYANWNPFIVGARGRIEVGSRLQLRMQPVGARAVTLKPTVVHVVEGACLRWRGTLGIPGLLDAEHEFRVTERDGGSTLHQDELFRGLLVPAMVRSLHRRTFPAFLAMNRALKLRAEQVGTAAHG